MLRVDAGSSSAAGNGFAPGTQIVEVTARWAIAGTYVTEFLEPLEIIFSNPSGVPAIPAWSSNGTTSWNTMGPLGGTTLPAAQRDGFYRASDGVHVLTRHLTFFGLMLDDDAPTEPRDLAGVVAADGLTVRWVPGTDSSGQLGNVVMFVNGEPYRNFGPTELEAKLGDFARDDTRTFTLVQTDAAGNTSRHTRRLRAVPQLTGMGLDEATAALDGRGLHARPRARGAERNRRARHGRRPDRPEAGAGVERDRPRGRPRRRVTPRPSSSSPSPARRS